MNTPRPRLAGSTALAACMALFLLSGRWNLGRVISMDASAFTAPRVWLVMLIGFIALIPVSRRARPALPPVGLLAFFGYFLLSTMWAPDDTLAVVKASDLLVMALGLLCLRRLTLLAGVRATTDSLWRVVAVLFGALAAIGLASSVLSGGGRLAVLGGGPNVYGRNMGLLLVVCFGAVLDGGKRGWPLVGLTVAALLVILSGSRGALAGTLVGVGGLLFMRRVQVGRTAIALVGSSLALAAIVRWSSVGRSALEGFQHRVVVLTFEQSYDSGRGPLRDAALEMVARSPWFGDGLNGFRARGHGVYPHNLELEALTDGGILGLIVLLLALAVPIVAIVVRSRRVDPTTAAVFLLHLACAQVSGDFYDSRGVFLFGMLLTLQFIQRQPAAQRPAPLRPVDPYRTVYAPKSAPPAQRSRAMPRHEPHRGAGTRPPRPWPGA